MASSLSNVNSTETGHVAFGHFSQTTVGSGECIADMFESFFKFDVPSTASTRMFVLILL